MLINVLNGDLGPKMRVGYLEKLERRRHSADSIVGHAHLVSNEEKEHCDTMIMIMRRKDPHFILMVIRMRRVILEPQVHE